MVAANCIRSIFVFLVVGVLALGQGCPPQGATLDVSGGRLGDFFSLGLIGPANAPGVLAFDLGAGPVPTPLGPICLDLSPALGTLAVATDSSGTWQIAGLLPGVGAISGLEIFLQAALADGSQPLGFALSNGGRFAWRSPHLYFLDPGANTPIGTAPGSVASFDVLNGTTGFSVPLTAPGADFVRVPSLGWILVLQEDDTLVALDQDSGAATTAALPASTSPPSVLELTADETTLLVLYPGFPATPFSPFMPGFVHVVSLPSLAVTATIPLSTANPDAILSVPGSTVAYLRAGTDVVAIDYAAGSELATISMGPGFGAIRDWLLQGTSVVTLLGGMAANPFGGSGAPSGLNGLDLLTNAPLHPSPVMLSSSTSEILRFGPGTAGDALFVLQVQAMTLLEVNATTFMIQGTVPLPSATSQIELSSGGSEWLLVRPGNANAMVAGTLTSLNPLTHAINWVEALPAEAQYELHALRSDTLRSAWMLSGTSTLLSIPTDPTAGPPVSHPAPLSIFGQKVIGE